MLHRNLLLIAAMTLLASGPALADTASKPLTPERVFASPGLNGPAARGVEVSPDGKWISWLKAEAANQFKFDLWAAPTAGGGLYIADADTGKVTPLKAAGTGATDGRLSPKGTHASYVRDQTLFSLDLTSGAERALSPKGDGTVSYGTAEFVAQEEMGRYTGYWWSPDEAFIAYTRVDDAPVEIAQRLEIGTDGATKITPQRYPRAGTPNALVSLFVKPLTAGAAPVKVDLGADSDIYLARAKWSRDGGILYVERQNRAQTQLDLLAVDPRTGAAHVVLSERQTPWVSLDDDFYPLEDGGFLWGSARTGHHHLYLYDAKGVLVHAVTSGDVAYAGGGGGAGVKAPGLAGVDEAKGLAYVMASAETPIEHQLYVVSYRDPGPPKAITSGHGWWTAVMPKAANVFVGYYSDPATPPQTALYDTSGQRLRWIEENPLNASHPFAPYVGRYPAPEFGVLKAADGEDLHYMVQKPVGFDPSRKYPAIVEVYGGPGVQTVTRTWGNPRDRLYLEAGYILFALDNRGSANRSEAFQFAISRRMGSVEVDDQLVGVNWLRAQPFVAADRIGVSGWSYGGYMTLRMMTDPRTHLKAGAAGAPPTDWRQYDTHYTEHYMGRPQDDEAAYDASAVIPRLKDLQGRLLLMQGLADDNVQVTNSFAVMAKLQSLSTPFDLMLFPGQRHGIQGEAQQLQLWRTYLAFFKRELQP